MGYRGKVDEQTQARALRAQAWTLAEIAAELGVSRSSVSLGVRDVPFDESARAARARANRGVAARRRGPNALARRKQDGFARLLAEGRRTIGTLSDGQRHRHPTGEAPPPVPGRARSGHPQGHLMGCARVSYARSRTHRAIMGLIGGLLS